MLNMKRCYVTLSSVINTLSTSSRNRRWIDWHVIFMVDPLYGCCRSTSSSSLFWSSCKRKLIARWSSRCRWWRVVSNFRCYELPSSFQYLCCFGLLPSFRRLSILLKKIHPCLKWTWKWFHLIEFGFLYTNFSHIKVFNWHFFFK